MFPLEHADDIHDEDEHNLIIQNIDTLFFHAIMCDGWR